MSTTDGRPLQPVRDDGSDPWYTKAEAVAYSRRSARTIERAVAAGELQAGGTRGKRAYKRSAIDAWLAVAAALVLWALCVVACALGVEAAHDFLDELGVCPLSRMETGAAGVGLPSMRIAAVGYHGASKMQVVSCTCGRLVAVVPRGVRVALRCPACPRDLETMATT